MQTLVCVCDSRSLITLSVPEQIAGGLVVTNTNTIMAVASFHRVAERPFVCKDINTSVLKSKYTCIPNGGGTLTTYLSCQDTV
jgi:hypothetical protein